jgi:charged multivesicular body protein 4
MNGQAFNALKGATSALKNVHKELDVDSVQDIMDELAEQHELSNEIANAISSPVGKKLFILFFLKKIKIFFLGFGAEIDDFELENELAQLEQEAIAKEMAQIDLPTVPVHSVPAYAQPATAPSSKVKNDQLAELERWAS